MKADSNAPGSPFNFDFIPLLLYPDVWDETKVVKLRGLWFIFLYTLSTITFAACIFVPIAFFKPWKTTLIIGLIFGLLFGPFLGLAVWRDFANGKRKIKSKM
jgi:hypothetical protein